jgi:uncharacterized protein YegP (UPF0339 family)
MASSGVLQRWYRERIGQPRTDDEVYGYWLFVAGIVLGTVGLVVFYLTPSLSGPREVGYILGALGVVGLFVGPTLRLPLSRQAVAFSLGGTIVCVAATVWFTLLYPGSWTGPEGNPAVTLYVFGLVLVVFGAVITPLLTHRPEGSGDSPGREAGAAESTAEDDMPDTAAGSHGADAQTEDATAARDSLASDLARSEAAREELSALLDRTDAELAAAQETLATAMDSKATFEVYEDRAGKPRWRLRHRNGNIIADGGQGYSSMAKAMQGLRSVQANAAGGAVVVLPSATEDDTAEDVPTVPAPESQGTFEVYEDRAGEHRWRLRHDNGNIVADSGEGYASRAGVRRALETVRAGVPSAPYLTLDPVGFELYPDAAGEYRWRLLHRNGRILADSGEGYASRRNARRAADRVREIAATATLDDGFEVYEDRAGEHRWRLRADNGEIVADSGEGYSDRSSARDAVERIQRDAGDADLLAIGSTAFEVYEDRAGEFRWRLRARNGSVVADSGEGYTERNKAVRAIERVKRHAPGAEQVESGTETSG